MKYRFYITDTFNGCISGTNLEEDAFNMASCEDYFVLDTLIDAWISTDGPVEIKEIVG